MPTPHDALFKLTFSDPAHAAPLLRTALPPALAERIDWDTLERLPTHFITEELRARQTDLLFRVRLKGHEGHEARLILLFEHASQSDDWLVLRVVEYTFLILKDYLREYPKTHLLPAVVPIVLHHSEKGWTSPVELHQLFDLTGELKQILSPYLLNHRLIVDDLSQQTDDALHRRVSSELAELVLLLLKSLRHAPDALAKVIELLPLIAQVTRAPNGVAALGAVVKYILTVTNADVPTLTHLFTTQINQETGDLAMTTAKQLYQEGLEKGIEQGIEKGRIEGLEKGRVEGIEKGIEKGRVEGRVEKQRQTLAKLIKLRLWEPDASTLARIQAAGEDELDLWIERILTAKKLSQLFA